MDLRKLLVMQKELDDVILDKYNDEDIYSFKHKDLLTERILALSVEVGELANATRCFKYWSEKESEPKERVLDEFADVLHFVLSIGHTLEFTAEEIEQAYLKKHEENYKRQENGY